MFDTLDKSVRGWDNRIFLNTLKTFAEIEWQVHDTLNDLRNARIFEITLDNNSHPTEQHEVDWRFDATLEAHEQRYPDDGMEDWEREWWNTDPVIDGLDHYGSI